MMMADGLDSITLVMSDGRSVTTDPKALKQAVRKLKAGGARRRAAGQPQRDLEEPDQAGVSPAQEAREAEAMGIAADCLRSIVDRIERLQEERKALGEDIKDIFAEAKGAGFDVKALRALLRLRTWEPAELEEHETLLDLYRRALGM